jgi:class 3 adenylate cyclase/streptogramin lyase
VLRSRRTPQRFLATILFTDIVGSTDIAAKVGDQGWRRLVAAHHATVRRELRRFGGREVDTAGDGFFATFGQPAQAVRAADAIVAAIAELGVSIRAGLHTGEAEAIADKVGGIAIHIASRVMAAAGPGEVIVSGTVRDLVAGSGLDFEDRGTHELKGVPGEWHLWALVRAAATVDESAIGSIVRVPEADRERLRRRRSLGLGVLAGVSAVAVVFAAAFGLGLVGGSGSGGGGSPPAPPASFALRANTVVALDAATGQVVRVSPVSEGPEAIAVDGGAVWVASVQAGVVTRLDADDPSAMKTFGRVARPSSIAIGGGVAWIADAYEHRLTLLDSSTGEQRDSLDSTHARRLAYGFDALWGTDDIADRLVRFDRQTGSVSSSIELASGAYPTGLALGPDAIWVANVGTQTLARVDPAAGKATVEGIPVRGTPDGIAASATDVWVTSTKADLLMRIEPATNTITSTVSVGDAPDAVAVDGGVAGGSPAGASGVWVACAGAGQVWHVGRDGQVLAKIDVGGRPTALAVAGGRVWVTVAPR